MSPKPLVRFALPLLAACALAACASLNAVSAWLGNQVSFTAPQLQRKLDYSFPRDFDKLGGLVSARLSNPRLALPPGEKRLRLDFDVQVNALGGAQVAAGRFALASGLRYEPSTQGLHLQDPELLSIDIPGGGSLLQGGTRTLLNTVLAEYARNQPVYTLESDLLNKLPLGKRIGTTEIDNGRVIVHLAD